jgi:hypothetical protein
LEKTSYRWEENIIVDLREIGRCGLDTTGSGWGPVLGSCEHNNEPSSYIKGREFVDFLR